MTFADLDLICCHQMFLKILTDKNWSPSFAALNTLIWIPLHPIKYRYSTRSHRIALLRYTNTCLYDVKFRALFSVCLANVGSWQYGSIIIQCIHTRTVPIYILSIMFVSRSTRISYIVYSYLAVYIREYCSLCECDMCGYV